MTPPKKVYIDDFGSGFSHGWHTEHSYENDIEYVRKDNFIEKACGWLSKVSIEDMEYKYEGFDTSEGWYKFIEDFRKAMEE